MTIHAYAVKQIGQPLQPFTYEEEPLKAFDVEIKITHCGICHSDLHLIHNDWNISQYPLVPGHEIVGTVVACGDQVRDLQKGQRVGVGWQRGSCLTCEQCISSNEQLCPEHQATCVGHHGGFADKIRVDSRFTFVIPDSLSSENAAPLLCGGTTVYSALRHYNVHPSMRVGVIGIGGLGHLALQFARAYGCEVTAFSSSDDKEAEAKKFGAHHFIASKDPTSLTRTQPSLHFILSTVFAPLNWAKYLQLLRPNGRLCFVGVSDENMPISPAMLVHGQKAVCGSVISGRAGMREMLEFAARHNITAQTECIPMGEVNKALAKLQANQARYRLVLKN